MKRLTIICAATLIAILAVGCQPGTSTSTLVYSGLTASGDLASGWQETTIREIESLLNTQLPVPTYLPPGYAIKEVYYRQEPNSSPQVTDILLLISEQQVQWVGDRYTCRLALSLGWNEAGLGLKMPWAEFISDIRGRLEDKEGEYILWWESYGSPKSLGSTMRLHASRQFSKEELIKIAASTPLSAPASTAACSALAVYMDHPYPGEEGVNYIESPVTITGYVSSPEAKVTVNGVEAEVAGDGTYSATIQFKKGSNSIQAVATLGEQTDEITYIVGISDNGTMYAVPGLGSGGTRYQSMVICDDAIELKPGETKMVDLTLEVKKDIGGQVGFRYIISRVAGDILQLPLPEEMKAPFPDGLGINIEPSAFSICPNTTYHSTLTVKTSHQLSPGEYLFFLESYYGTSAQGHQIKITVKTE
jgi:hypothetical protein